MKKYIAIFTVLALALSVSTAAFAGTDLMLRDLDDTFIYTSRANTNTFGVHQDAFAMIHSDLDVTVNSGGNSLWAGGDLDAGSVDSGDSNLNYTENSAVNDLVVAFSGCGCDDSSEIKVDADDVDDTFIGVDDTNTNNEIITSETKLIEHSDDNFTANTGGNSAGSFFGDTGEDSPVTVDSGNATATIIRGILRNTVQIERL